MLALRGAACNRGRGEREELPGAMDLALLQNEFLVQNGSALSDTCVVPKSPNMPGFFEVPFCSHLSHAIPASLKE